MTYLRIRSLSISLDDLRNQGLFECIFVEDQVYRLTQDQARAFIITHSPLKIELNGAWTKEQLTLDISLKALQIIRWGLDEAVSKKNPDDYHGVNPTNYGQALDVLIARFGGAEFGNAVERVFKRHLDGLHSKVHTKDGAHQIHSDVGTLQRTDIALAEEALLWTHPLLPYSVLDGNYILNAKTLFGDEDFWSHIRDRHPGLFNSFVDFILSLPRQYPQKNEDVKTIIDPVALVKQHFRKAWDVIYKMRPDFDSPTEQAIRPA